MSRSDSALSSVFFKRLLAWKMRCSFQFHVIQVLCREETDKPKLEYFNNQKCQHSMKLLPVPTSAFQGEIQFFALFNSCNTTLTLSPCPFLQAVGIWDSN